MNREALIEEAAKAILNEMGGIVPDELEQMHADAARAALAVFEQAHTPTDDEREILTRIIHDETGEPEEESGFVADAILAAGFRRPVQGEPTAAQLLAQGFSEGVNFIDNHPGPWGAGVVAGRSEAARRRAAADEQGGENR